MLVSVVGLAREIVCNCGFAPILVVGVNIHELLKTLLLQGVDAFGYEVGEHPEAAKKMLEGRLSKGGLPSIPFEGDTFNSIVLLWEHDKLDADILFPVLGAFYRISKKNVFLRILCQPKIAENELLVSRSSIEAKCFELGLRKSPFYYRVNEYSSLQNDSGVLSIPLEKVPLNAVERFPLSILAEERDLHMDMLRESGSRSDAHVFRYDLASHYIRPGDIVLDAACGLGYGSYLLSLLTKAKSVTGIDGSGYGIEYATQNYAVTDRIQFVEGYLPSCLNAIPDQSVDCIVSFETLEHVEQPELLLAEFYRVLTPGGRIICSVPNDWSDESGEDPNPFHLHVYDAHKFNAHLSALFAVEKIFGQTADRVKKSGSKCEWLVKPRSCHEVGQLDPLLAFESEWLIGVASKSPLVDKREPYVERMFSAEQVVVSGNALAFSRDYENPWLVKSLISMGVRTESSGLRKSWATAVLGDAPQDSADYGAALCVLIYLSIESDGFLTSSDFISAAEKYIQLENIKNPTVMRWQVSVAYALAIKLLMLGDRKSAEIKLQEVLDFPIQEYSVTLFTKFAQAAYTLGVLKLSQDDHQAAKVVWRGALSRLKSEFAKDWSVSCQGVQPEFELRESASVVSLMARLSSALANLTSSKYSPLVFYNEITADCASQLQLMHGHILSLEQRNSAAVNQIKNLEQMYAKCLENGGARESEQESYVSELLAGKEWLEEQWKSQLNIIARQENKINGMVANFWVRLLIKFGFLKL